MRFFFRQDESDEEKEKGQSKNEQEEIQIATISKAEELISSATIPSFISKDDLTKKRRLLEKEKLKKKKRKREEERKDQSETNSSKTRNVEELRKINKKSMEQLLTRSTFPLGDDSSSSSSFEANKKQRMQDLKFEKIKNQRLRFW